MNNNTFEKQAYEMFLVANDYCIFLENHYKHNKEYILDYLHKILPLIYLKIVLLPTIEIEEDYQITERFVSEDQWEFFYNSLKKIFNQDNTYYFWNSNLNEPQETSLSENFADIYQDLKDYVFLYSKNSTIYKQNAVYYLKLSFIEHLSTIITTSLSHLNFIIYNKNNNLIL